MGSRSVSNVTTKHGETLVYSNALRSTLGGYTKEQAAKNVKVTMASSPFSSCSSCSMQSGSTTPQNVVGILQKWGALGLPNCKYIKVQHFHPVQRYLCGHLYTTSSKTQRPEEGTLATMSPWVIYILHLNVPALHTVRAAQLRTKSIYSS